MTPRVTPTPAPAAVRRVLLLCGAAAFCAGVVRLNERRAPWSADEVDLASLAVAMLHRGAAWIRPTYHPLDPDAFARLGDGIIAPPLASALMAVPGLLGVRLPGAWPVVGALLLVAGIAAVVRAVTPQRWTLVLLGVAATLALAPGLALDLLKLEAEIPLTGFGLLGLALALDPRARGAPFRLRPALSGALLGLAFLCKLWLAAPLVLAAAFAWYAGEPPPAARRAATLGLFAAALALVSGAHLALVAALDPASLGRWLREVYFAVLGLGGVAVTKWSGVAAHPDWSHGPLYYPPAIARELGFAAPLAAFGLWRVALAPRQRARARLRPLRAALLGLALGGVALSVPRIKEPLYVLPAIAMGAALATRTLLLSARRPRGGLVLAGAALVGVGVAAWCQPPVYAGAEDRPDQWQWLTSAGMTGRSPL